ncbi:MAG TPA: LPS assembly lipoprotein LptE [Candidatus Mcinerneyibacterium sp.]|nr:LPS assembly lipoprotein LptE [Candidatus Mcinerneyibacterium sp.]
MKKIFLILILTFFIFSCYYTFKSTRFENIKSIYIENIKNETDEYRFNQYLQDEINKTFISDTDLSVKSKSQSDSILKLKIKEYDKEVVAIDLEENPTSKRVKIVVAYEFIINEETAEKNDNYIFEYNYLIDENISDEELLQIISKELATDLKEQIIEGF